ncbi:uncharacterized protein SPPG_07036 [Spizellomyces punctatus DAOM BR117]|uniref:ISWI chromatin-remodeling complex ATPase ISW2 n=1 Tax=Spizellomyces punctatus (strain DAOM BR117) TaxID=645134 RepID=A0A0L0HA78_SPIPD|nr:uncharacterized protein SPPG_07036 [Spizellomyces punctatus DAOM BR117]KNC97563.1 hypothetical protein SPPG_07036 [Spizellomyces punctatus DAOM BR117]|eukprot:XP_016605603.1 hypothetical protein SPPG_07036 [Spizellomyces punctatus DAOM BR117]
MTSKRALPAGEDEETENQVPETATKRQRLETAQRVRNATVRSADSSFHEKRIQWFWEHRDLFEPLLPEKSFFTKLAECPPLGETIPRREVPTPASVQATLKDYQMRGLSFLVHMYENGVNAILGDEMGLGKTLQTLSLFAHIKEHSNGGPFLVVCPLSVLGSWATEISRWTPSLTSITIHGAQSERARIKSLCLTNQYDIYVTTYEQYVAEQGWFKSFRWKIVVLDEGHKIKNENTNVSVSLRGLNAQFRLLLTGTPLQNNLHELWALLHWLFPEVFTPKTVKKFDESFDLNKGQYDLAVLDYSRRLLERIMLRRLKNQVDFQIPPKEEMTLYVPLSPMQRFWYKRLLTGLDTMTLQEVFSATHKESSEEVHSASEMKQFEETKAAMEYSMKAGGNEWKKLMNLLMQLRKCCNHPYMLPNSEPEPFLPGEHLVLASSKMVLLDKLLKHLKAGGHRSLLFSSFTGMLDILEDYLIYRGVSYCRLDGSTARPRRNLDIRLFNHKDSPYEVFLISTRAGGLGINLTAADTVIFFDNEWNPQVDLQALARAHRIGQKKTVRVYRIVCQDTVEEQMQSRLQKKLFLSAKVTEDMQDPTAVNEPRFTKGELMSMLRRGARAITRIFESPEEFIAASMNDILQKSREYQKRVDGEAAIEDQEEFTLEGMEIVQSRVFEGRVVHKTAKDIGNEWNELAKRVREDRVVMVDGHAVLKETVGCDMWEARSTFSKNAVIEKKRRRRKFAHEEVCHACSDEDDQSKLLGCTLCPRSYHPKCVGMTKASAKQLVTWSCPQHLCVECLRKTGDAGGMLFRCQSCSNAFCEDCLDFDEIFPVGDVLPEFLLLGFPKVGQAYYIRCTECLDHYKTHPDALKDLEEQMERDWKEVEKQETEIEEVKEVKEEVKVEKQETKKVERKSRQALSPRNEGTTSSSLWPADFCERVRKKMRASGLYTLGLVDEIRQLDPSVHVTKMGLEKILDRSVNAPAYLLGSQRLKRAVEVWVGGVN